MLFIQKQDDESGVIGFVNPYLTENQQIEWNAVSRFSACCVIRDEMSLLHSIRDLQGPVHEEIAISLRYFLQDKTTTGLGITYSFAGLPITRGWVKA